MTTERRILCAVAGGVRTPLELMDALDLEARSTVYVSLMRLGRKGLVSRAPRPGHARSWTYSATQKGVETCATA